MNQMFQAFSGQLLAVVIVVLLSLGAAITVHSQRRWIFGLVPVATCLAAGSALSIAVVTLTPQSNAHIAGHRNFVPFHTMRGDLGSASDVAFYLLGNIALFVPLGFFLYLALRRGLFLPAFLAALTSVGVEILQLPIWSRSTDVDDVILNSAGGLLGVLTAAIVARLMPIPGLTGHSPGRRHSEVPGHETEAEQPYPTLLPKR